MKRASKISSVLGSFFVVALSFAGGPVTQESSNTGSVRIMVSNANTNFANATDGTFAGSGTVIDHKNVNGQGWICVLTADHVLSTTQSAAGASYASIGVGNGSVFNNTGASSGFRATKVMRDAARRTDLAVLGINYGTFNASFNTFRRSIWSGNTMPTSFTGEGFGAEMTDDPANNRWNRVTNYGVRRNWNMNGFTITPGASPTFNDYNGSQIIEWSSKSVTDPTSVAGHGQGADGDSGGAYFTSTAVTTIGSPASFFTSGIFGVQSFGRFAGPGDAHVNHGQGWGGVYLNAANRNWIMQQCQAVPEPSSLVAIVGGLMFIGSAQRRKK